MALEPMTPAAGDTDNPELRDMTRRFWVAVALSLPLLAIAMAEHFDKATLDALISPRLRVWTSADPRHASGPVGRLVVLRCVRGVKHVERASRRLTRHLGHLELAGYAFAIRPTVLISSLNGIRACSDSVSRSC
jgi:hypothetical protein